MQESTTPRTTRLVVLDPAQFYLRKGMEKEKEKVAAINAVVGIGGNKMQAEWAASTIFAVGQHAAPPAGGPSRRELLAHEDALAAPEMDHNLT